MARYQELSNVTDLDLQGLLAFPSLDTALFYPIFLGVFFITISLLMFFREVNREGKGNLLSSLAVGGFATQAVAVSLSLMSLLDTTTLVITVVITLVFQVLFMLTSRFP